MVNRDEIRELVRAAVEQSLQQPSAPAVYHAPWTGVAYEAHPSRQQFSVGEAAAGQRELLELVEAQLCTIEKNRTCDHCGLCKSLGF
jgi:hypothetical protein